MTSASMSMHSDFSITTTPKRQTYRLEATKHTFGNNSRLIFYFVLLLTHSNKRIKKQTRLRKGVGCSWLYEEIEFMSIFISGDKTTQDLRLD
jgi:hypothetical protein